MKYIAQIAGVVVVCASAYVIYNYYRKHRSYVQQIYRSSNIMPTAHNISENGKTLIANQEGLRLTVYRDVAGFWTIGRGHKIVKGDNIYPFGTRKTITLAEANALFISDIANIAVNPINSLVKVPLNQNQFDALCSLVYNMGAGNFAKSSLLASLNSSDYSTTANSFSKYNKSGNPPKELTALTNRRKNEATLFIS